MTTLALTYVPIIESMHVYLNGVEAQFTTDWTYDAGSNSVVSTSALDVQSGDKFECRYAHYEG